MISKEKKTAIMKEYARFEGDTGSPEVQIAVLSARIAELTEHLKEHPKDNQTWYVQNGRSETWSFKLLKEQRHREIPCFDRETWSQKVIW